MLKQFRSIFPVPTAAWLLTSLKPPHAVKVPDFQSKLWRTIFSQTYLLEALGTHDCSFLKILFFNFWDNISPGLPHICSLFSEISFSAHSSNRIISQKRLYLLFLLQQSQLDPQSMSFKWSTSGVSRWPKLGHFERSVSLVAMIRLSWMNEWSWEVSVKQD